MEKICIVTKENDFCRVLTTSNLFTESNYTFIRTDNIEDATQLIRKVDINYFFIDFSSDMIADYNSILNHLDLFCIKNRVIAFCPRKMPFGILKVLTMHINVIITNLYIDSDIILAINAIRNNTIFYSCDVYDICRNSDLVSKFSFEAKEIEFIKLCGSELTYDAISIELGIDKIKIANLRSSLFKKYGVSTRLGLVLKASHLGMCPLGYLNYNA